MTRIAVLALFLVAFAVGCERTPGTAQRHGPPSAPSEWSTQRGQQTGAPSASVGSSGDMADMQPRSSKRTFLLTASVTVSAIGVVIGVTVWWLERRRRRHGGIE